MADASFAPLWASPPGATLRDRLDDLGLGFDHFAEQIGASTAVVERLLDGREVITIDLARRLSQVVGPSIEFWVNRDCQYRDDLERVATDRWLQTLPVKKMVEYGWIDADPASHTQWAARVDACLSFFDVNNETDWSAVYEPIVAGSLMRISEARPRTTPAIASWLRQAIRQAEALNTSTWDAELLRNQIPRIKTLTRLRDPAEFIPRLQDLLANAGVALAVVRAMPGCPASGAARFLSEDRAMIVVSVRNLVDDQFWFTVMHEVAHLLLHGPEHQILDDPWEEAAESDDEREANDFAADVLLPPEVRDLVPAGRLSHRQIAGLALRAGVSPGIIVGQLQHDGRIRHDQLNRLKRRYHWNGLTLEKA